MAHDLTPPPSIVGVNTNVVPTEPSVVPCNPAIEPAPPLSEGGEVPLDQVVHLTSVCPSEETFNRPTIRMLFASKEEGQRVARLALALDSTSAATLPLLVESSEQEEWATLGDGMSFTTALAQAVLFPGIRTLTFGGSAGTMIDLAAGGLEQVGSPEEAGEGGLNNDFLAILAVRHYLDPAIIQNLREVRSSTELLQLVSRRRLGWLFDEICRLACLEVRKRLHHSATLETIAFGSSGAVLGRAVIEAGSFDI